VENNAVFEPLSPAATATAAALLLTAHLLLAAAVSSLFVSNIRENAVICT
jgi:hypothetical protein